MTYTESIGIIGAGKLGLSLALACDSANIPFVIGSRNPARAQNALREYSSNSFSVLKPSEAAKQASLILLTCADHDIEPICDEVSATLEPQTVISHCSGVLTSSSLTSAERQGALTASTHPLNTFPTLQAAVNLVRSSDHGTVVFAEGNSKALLRLERFWQALGFSQQTIKTQSKVLYHTACVMACNHMTATIDASLDIASAAGMDRADFAAALTPILRTTLKNISAAGTLASLSGPVARGDALTVAKHIAALEETGIHALTELYRQLAQHALKMATANDLSSADIGALQKVFAAKD